MNSPKINVKNELVDYVYRVYTKKVGAETILDDWSDTSDMIKDILDKSNEFKYCMPEGINTKEEHEQYLKDIGYEKYVKDLEHFKDVHVGLYVIDKMIDDIFTDTPEEKDCKTVVEAYLVQQFKRLKSLMWRIS